MKFKEGVILLKEIWTKYSYIFTISFFILGFFNIIFAWIALFCLISPFVFVVKDKKTTWCHGYCPRANFLTRLSQRIKLSDRPAPKWLLNGNGKRIMLIYFLLNIFMITMSTIMVFIGKITAVERIRFLIAFWLPWEIPQFLNISGIPDWAVHLSFRLYSMMFTTTIIGLVLALFYKARTWCAICPMGTLSSLPLKNKKSQKAA
jgi:hypothetical protein